MDDDQSRSSTKILLTGCSGFIGKQLISQLIQSQVLLPSQSTKLVLLTRQKVKNHDLEFDDDDQQHQQHQQHPGVMVEYFEGDILNLSGLYECMKQHPDINCVIHLAALMDFFPVDPALVYRTNVEGTMNLLKAFTTLQHQDPQLPPKHLNFIYVSSTESIGASPKDPSIKADEQYRLRPSYDYGRSKIEAEATVAESCQQHSINYLILRPTGVLGPHDKFTAFELMQMINWGLLFVIPGTGQYMLMYTHIDDVISAIVTATQFMIQVSDLNYLTCSDRLNQIYIVCSNEGLLLRRWIEIISEECGRMKPTIHLPIALVKFVTIVLSLWMNKGKGSRVFMYKIETVDRMVENRVYDNSKFKSAFPNWNPKQHLEQSVRETVQWNFQKKQLSKFSVAPFWIFTWLLLLLLLFILFLFVILVFIY